MAAASEHILAQALQAHQSGNLAQAEQQYRTLIAAHPDHADACALLGVTLASFGKYDEAIEWVNKAVALDPFSGLLRFHLGTILMAAQNLPQAVASLARAVTLQPDKAQFRYNYANALRATDDWHGAMTEYRAALRIDPHHTEAYNNLVLSLVHEKNYDEAGRLAKEATVLHPDDAQAWLTLCNVTEALKDYEASYRAGLRATALDPTNHFTWFGLGVALNRLNRDGEAVTAYQRALTLKPERVDIWDNLAQSYQSLNRLEEAHQTFLQAVDKAGQKIIDEETREVNEDEYGNRHWHLSLIELLRGDYKRGFARYRSRVKEIAALKRPAMPFPLWKGENLNGKTLLVCDEQGYGDTLMMARFLPLVKAQGARVIFSVHKVLEPYLRGCSGADEVIIHNGPAPACDYFCSSFDLPHRLGVTLENLPNRTPYLPLLPPDEAAKLLPTNLPDGGFKIGVVWGGSPLHLADAKRSIPLPLFVELFTTPGVQFYNFNRDLKIGDAALLPQYPIENLVPHLNNFATASRFINQMDLIITCDTATAHLAGGMGKQVWVLLPFAPDWRWLTGRSDSPWYPTMRLFRQPKPTDWVSVIQEVKSELIKNLSQS